MKKKKAQAAIEFLTTYSWAIMIIFLTIGALTYFDIFNTSRFISERCETGAQISCVEAQLTISGAFNIRLVNNYPVDIEVTSVTLNVYGVDHSSSGTTTIPRGEIIPISFNTPNTFSRNSKEMFDVTISFRRVGGTEVYDIKGNVVLRPI